MQATFEQLIQSDKPLLIDFWATWCGPCRTMMPVLEALKSEMGDRVRIVKIDVDKNTDLAVAMKVMGVPTFMIYKNGRQYWSQAGVVSKHELKHQLELVEQAS